MERGIGYTTRRFTVDEVLRMVEIGLLGDHEHVELLDGELVEMSPQGPEHAGPTTRLVRRLIAAYGDAYLVREGKPLVSGPTALPEPDIAVVEADERAFDARHPHARECTLVVECARTSQRVDHEKASIYAAAGAPTYWLLDLTARRLEVHTEPQPDGRYGLVRLLTEDAEVSPPGTSARWQVRELLP